MLKQMCVFARRGVIARACVHVCVLTCVRVPACMFLSPPNAPALPHTHHLCSTSSGAAAGEAAGAAAARADDQNSPARDNAGSSSEANGPAPQSDASSAAALAVQQGPREDGALEPQQHMQLAKLRSYFHKDVRKQLYTESDDRHFFDNLKVGAARVRVRVRARVIVSSGKQAVCTSRLAGCGGFPPLFLLVLWSECLRVVCCTPPLCSKRSSRARQGWCTARAQACVLQQCAHWRACFPLLMHSLCVLLCSSVAA